MNDKKLSNGMIDHETGVQLTDEEILKEGMNHLSEACCFFYELYGDEYIALGFMADAAIRYGQAIIKGRDPRLSEEFYEEENNNEP